MIKIKTLVIAIAIILTWGEICNAQVSLIKKSKALEKQFENSDPLFKKPYIDVDEMRSKPVSHRYVHGGFEGTGTRFSFYLPEKRAYKGRFFQYITPAPDNENLSQNATGEEDKISFSLLNGSYFIETNGGGNTPEAKADATVGAYRANAASASFSKVVASEVYGPHRTYGYAFGGSGGAYRTIGGLESTEGVWDGAVPYVPGSPMALPNVFSVRMHAMRVLGEKLSGIADAVEAGGSGDIYAGLSEEEKGALIEVTKMGFPIKSWFDYKTMGVHGFSAIYGGMVSADPSYFSEDFWTKPGYLGSSESPSLKAARIQAKSRIKTIISFDEAVKMKLIEAPNESERGTADLAWKSLGLTKGSSPVIFELEDSLPDTAFLGGDLLIQSGKSNKKQLQLGSIKGKMVFLGSVDPAIASKVAVGDAVEVNNSNFLAAQTYHRHQVPDKTYRVWDQFRNSDGSPLYPQRKIMLGPIFTKSASGVLPIGKFKGKMIMLSSLYDREAFPWQADWYRSRVKEFLGEKEKDNYRLWYTDKALHGDLTKQENPTKTVSYVGVLQEALLSLSDWVENGVPPAASTRYSVEDGQIIVAKHAGRRNGVQPTVELLANGKKVITLKVNEEFKLKAIGRIPKQGGSFLEAKWDFDGSGQFAKSEKINEVKGRKTTLKAQHSFSRPGVYFITIKVLTQRKQASGTPFNQISNLDRVRIIVE